MAHEFESGLFVSKPAWHGLGTVLENAPSVADALQLAGLDWKAEKRPVFLADGTRVDSHRAIVRDIDGAVLGVMGNQFEPLQNVDAFASVADIIDSGEATIEAAGSLRGGKRIWILAALKGGELDVQRGDSIKSHLLLAHGHDGSLAIRFGFTTTRVVCSNTLAVAMRDDQQNLLTVRHTKGAQAKLESAKELFDLKRGQLKADVEKYKFLASRKCDDANLVRYVRETLKPGSADDKKQVVRNVDDVTALFENGRGAELSRGTMWGAFNAVTEYATHERGRGADSRQASSWFGNGAKLADRALDVAMQFAEDAPLAEMGRQASRNTASAHYEMKHLLGKTRPATTAPDAGGGDFASLLDRPRAS